MINLLTFTANRDIIVTVKSKQQPREGRKDHTMKTYEPKAYELTCSDGRGNYSALVVIAESAEQAAAYYTVEQGANVITCTATAWPAPEQPRGYVPLDWVAPVAETETAERAAETINPMCAECVKRGTSCPGTTCRSFTGCIYRETILSAGSPTERSKTPAHITTASTAKLLDYWDYVRRLSYSAATALTRGWVLDELERRDPAGFARWLDSDDDSDYDATLRDFIRCDDAHVAWLYPQTATTWRPGDAREGARA